MANDTGGLWRNQYKGKHAKRPDMVGSITIDGVKYKLAAWNNDKGKQAKGMPALSIVATKQEQQPQAAPITSEVPPYVPPQTEDFDDDCPF